MRFGLYRMFQDRTSERIEDEKQPTRIRRSPDEDFVQAMSHIEPIDRDFLLNQIEDGLLPKPVKVEHQLGGRIVMVGGKPGEVIVRITGSKVSVAVFTVRWEGAHARVVRLQVLGTLSWRCLPANRLMMALDDLVCTAAEMRRAEYRKCELCGEIKPPEWMHNATTCQSCAEQHLGVFY
jgi:hypothetical protein